MSNDIHIDVTSGYENQEGASASFTVKVLEGRKASPLFRSLPSAGGSQPAITGIPTQAGGQWNHHRGALPEGTILWVQAKRKSEIALFPRIENYLLRLRGKAGYRKITMPTCREASSTRESVYLEGRFDFITYALGQSLGIKLYGNPLVALEADMEVAECQIVLSETAPLPLEAAAYETEDGDTVMVALPVKAKRRIRMGGRRTTKG